MARTPVLPEVTPVGPLSARLRRPRPDPQWPLYVDSGPSARDPSIRFSPAAGRLVVQSQPHVQSAVLSAVTTWMFAGALRLAIS